MRELIKLVLVAAVAILGYRAYRQHHYQEGQLTTNALASVIQAADALNAQDKADVQKILAAARRWMSRGSARSSGSRQ